MTLVEFLEARISEDEAVAQAAIEAGGAPASTSRIFTSLLRPTGTVELPPDRVLAECAAKRAIVAYLAPDLGRGYSSSDTAEEVFRILALPYVDHSDYDVTWRNS
jgi:hypothetical protein